MNSFRTEKIFFLVKLFFFLINNLSFFKCKEMKINHNNEKPFWTYKNYCSTFRKILNGELMKGSCIWKVGTFLFNDWTDLVAKFSWWGWLCSEVSSLWMTKERRGRMSVAPFPQLRDFGSVGFQWAESVSLLEVKDVYNHPIKKSV